MTYKHHVNIITSDLFLGIKAMLKLWTLCVIVDKKHTKQARTKLKMFHKNESIPVGQQGGLVLNISLKACTIPLLMCMHIITG